MVISGLEQEYNIIITIFEKQHRYLSYDNILLVIGIY